MPSWSMRVGRHDGAHHSPPGRGTVREERLPEPDELGHLPQTILAGRPGVPCLHAHGQASSHRARSLTTLTSAS